jgi:hypothetical protein
MPVYVRAVLGATKLIIKILRVDLIADYINQRIRKKYGALMRLLIVFPKQEKSNNLIYFLKTYELYLISMMNN